MNLHAIPAPRMTYDRWVNEYYDTAFPNERPVGTEAMLRAERNIAENAALFTAEDIRRLQNQILGTWNEPRARHADPLRNAPPATVVPPERHDPAYWGIYDRPVNRAPVEPPARTSRQILDEIVCLSHEISRVRGDHALLDGIRFAVNREEMYNLQREIDYTMTANVNRGGIMTLYGIRLVVE